MPDNLKIAFCGSSDFVTPIIESIKESQGYSLSELVNKQLKNLRNKIDNIDQYTKAIEKTNSNKKIYLSFIITQPDRENRKKVISNPVAECSRKNQITLFQPQNINEDVTIEEKLKNTDICITASYGQLIFSKITNLPRYGFINWHPSLLPKYRGATPMQTAIARGDNKVGLSWIEVAKKMDAGNIYIQIEDELDKKTDIESLAWKMGALGSQSWALAIALRIAEEEGLFEPIIQDESKVVNCQMLKKQDSYVNPQTQAAKEIFNHYRAYKLFPKTTLECSKFGEIKLLSISEYLTNEEYEKIIKESQIIYPKNQTNSWIQLKNNKSLLTLFTCKEGYLTVQKIGLKNGKQVDLTGYNFA